MLRTIRDTYSEFCTAYAARDLDRCAGFVTDDVVFALYIDRDLAPFGGVSIGKGVMHQRWQMVMQAFDLLRYEATGIFEDPDKLRGLVAYHFRHKATGEDIAGTMRHVVRQRDGLMAHIEEHHDRTRVEAFFRLIRNNAPVLGPQPSEQTLARSEPTHTGCSSKA